MLIEILFFNKKNIMIHYIRFITFTFSILFFINVEAQHFNLKKDITKNELLFIKETIKQIKIKDQQFRKLISAETLDTHIINKTSLMYDSLGIEAGYNYEKNLNLKLEENVKDSLWEKQHLLDFQNHITIRGLIETYGYLSEDILGKDDYIQFLVLLHPPKDWDVELYQNEYSVFLKAEVKSGRMKPMFFAQFYDNMNCKILKKPQLYGTNKVFDINSRSTLPPIINDIAKTNQARIDIGLNPLKEGEFRNPE